ncbi:hypothetical protein ANRL4_05361 [Anaerolineae bacterium]|nr:hypothetical protein ANRL4_05361 [Anaerolineae bacterium]
MSERDRLLESIAATIADYRAGEIDPPTSQHVERWIGQFAEDVQIPMLAELDHVFEQMYLSRRIVTKFLSGLVANKKIAGDDPGSFWKGVRFLDIQGGGNSQKDMLGMFDAILQKKYDLELKKCGKNARTFLYLDDAIFSGNRVRNDLSSWIETKAPNEAEVHVVAIALHSGGRHYASTKIEGAAHSAHKKIEFSWWRCIEIEDRNAYINTSNVLRPARLPRNARTKVFVKMLEDAGYPPVLREAGKMGDENIFSSEEGRDLLEQQLVQAGLRIREICPYLKVTHRPLGYSVLKTLGFGSLLVTFRNCPNNCPLAFWAGDPWYPLFPRKIN